jgi:uncharacterized membrane protein YheB (UPF0754 family)
MKKFSIRIIITIEIIIIFCTSLFAAPNIHTAAVKIMREIKVVYKTEKTNKFLENYLKERNLSPEQISDVRERIDYFFDSQTFIETGAAYLTALFDENDLKNIFNAVRNGDFWENKRKDLAVKKVQKLFAELDPYLYRYLRQNIVSQPSDSQEKI